MVLSTRGRLHKEATRKGSNYYNLSLYNNNYNNNYNNDDSGNCLFLAMHAMVFKEPTATRGEGYLV